MNDEPKPFVDLISIGSEKPSVSSVNRVTFRTTLVRERWAEDYQHFPPNSFSGCEVSVSHRNPAFIMPDLEISGELVVVETGWVDGPRVLCILNRTVWKGVVKPTKQQKSDVESSVVLIGFDGLTFPLMISPGQCQTLLLNQGVKPRLYLVAKSGSPKVSIFAV
jgi:hypothetical protein